MNNENIRECSECHDIITEGYLIYDGEEYYCCDECLYKHYSQKEYELMYEQGYSYWTEFN